MLIHLVLDLAIDVSSRSFNVERGTLNATFSAHDHLASSILVTLQQSRCVLELQVPEFLLLHALRIGVEDVKQVATLFNLSVSICVHDLCKILHDAEVRSHSISESSDTAELRKESNLSTSASIFVDEQWLVEFFNLLVVAGLVVLFIGYLYT